MPIQKYRLSYFSLLLLLVFTNLSSPAHSGSYVPKSNQSVVASWTVPKPAQQPRVFIAQLLKEASKPGLASRYYGRASALLKPLLLADPNDIELKFYSATVLQHYHKFNQAQVLLSQILQQQPQHRTRSHSFHHPGFNHLQRRVPPV